MYVRPNTYYVFKEQSKDLKVSEHILSDPLPLETQGNTRNQPPCFIYAPKFFCMLTPQTLCPQPSCGIPLSSYLD